MFLATTMLLQWTMIVFSLFSAKSSDNLFCHLLGLRFREPRVAFVALTDSMNRAFPWTGRGFSDREKWPIDRTTNLSAITKKKKLYGKRVTASIFIGTRVSNKTAARIWDENKLVQCRAKYAASSSVWTQQCHTKCRGRLKCLQW